MALQYILYKKPTSIVWIRWEFGHRDAMDSLITKDGLACHSKDGQDSSRSSTDGQ